jgi:hypothetical protein
MKRALCISLLFLMLACSSSSDSNDSSNDDSTPEATNEVFGMGVLTLTGIDTEAFGETLTVGDVAFFLDEDGDIMSILFVDADSLITGGDLFDLNDGEGSLGFDFGSGEYFFSMTIVDDEVSGLRGISLGIALDFLVEPNPTPFNYGCNAPASGGFGDCEAVGGLFVDKELKEIRFVNVSMFPAITTAAEDVLVMNGTLSWN